MESLILLALAPIFYGCMLWEALYWRRRGVAQYTWRDTLSNMTLAGMHQVADGLAWLVLLGLYTAIYQLRLFDLETGVWTVAALFLAQDFFYYWFHRVSHGMRWMWASHVTHHSSERLNLSTAFRQSLTYPISGMWVFWLPLAWIGFEPQWVVLVVGGGICVQHPLPSSRAPRAQCRLRGQKFRRRAHHLGPPIRQFCRRAGRRTLPVRHYSAANPHA